MSLSTIRRAMELKTCFLNLKSNFTITRSCFVTITFMFFGRESHFSVLISSHSRSFHCYLLESEIWKTAQDISGFIYKAESTRYVAFEGASTKPKLFQGSEFVQFSSFTPGPLPVFAHLRSNASYNFISTISIFTAPL